MLKYNFMGIHTHPSWRTLVVSFPGILTAIINNYLYKVSLGASSCFESVGVDGKSLSHWDVCCFVAFSALCGFVFKIFRGCPTPQ